MRIGLPSERSTTFHACRRSGLVGDVLHRSENVTKIRAALRATRVAHVPRTKTFGRGPPRGMRHERTPTARGKIEKRFLFALIAARTAPRSGIGLLAVAEGPVAAEATATAAAVPTNARAVALAAEAMSTQG